MSQRATRKYSRGFAVAVIALVAAGILQGYLLLRKHNLGGERAARLAPRTVATLPNIALHTIPDPSFTGAERELRATGDLFDAPCAVLVFFHSGCAGCQDIAPHWTGVDALNREGRSLPVLWIGVADSDSNASGFLDHHGLPRPAFVFESEEDLLSWGVYRWPQVYVVTTNGAVVVQGGPLPEDVRHLPQECAETGGSDVQHQ